MAKTAPTKQKTSLSLHSRAAKRASSPSINTDKSLKNVKLPADSSDYRPSVLAARPGAGITKKSKSGRKSSLSAKARRRLERGQDRAEAVMDKKAAKVEKSRGKARTIQERSKGWEELNRRIIAKKAQEDANLLDIENWEDEDDANADIEPDVGIQNPVEALAANDTGMSENRIGILATEVVDQEDDEVL